MFYQRSSAEGNKIKNYHGSGKNTMQKPAINTHTERALTDVARDLKMSPSWVSRTERIALQKLKDELERRGVKRLGDVLEGSAF